MLAAEGYRVIVPYLRGYGTTRFLSDDTLRNGQQAALASTRSHFMDALEIDQAIVAGFDWGARTANIVAALWPERCKGHGLGERVPDRQPGSQQAAVAAGGRAPVVVPVLLRDRTRPRRLREVPARVREADLADRLRRSGTSTTPPSSAARRPSTTRITSRSPSTTTAGGSGSPKARRDTTSSSSGSPRAPTITVPTITLEGDANGAPHPDPRAYAGKFSGSYSHRTIDRRHRPQPPARSAGSLRRSRHRRRRLLTKELSCQTQRPAPTRSPSFSSTAPSPTHRAGTGSSSACRRRKSRWRRREPAARISIDSAYIAELLRTDPRPRAGGRPLLRRRRDLERRDRCRRTSSASSSSPPSPPRRARRWARSRATPRTAS